MSLSIVQQNGASGSSATASVTLPGAVGAGNGLIVLVRPLVAGGAVTGVSGGGATDFAASRADNNNGTWYSAIWMGTAVGGGSTTISATLAAAGPWTIDVLELSAGLTVNGVNGANGVNGTSMNSGNVTPAAGADCILVNCGCFQANTAAVAGPSGWTSTTAGAPSTAKPASYKLVPSASGSYNATYGIGYNRFSLSIVAFKAAAGGTTVALAGTVRL